jgi:hypothetical protein
MGDKEIVKPMETSPPEEKPPPPQKGGRKHTGKASRQNRSDKYRSKRNKGAAEEIDRSIDAATFEGIEDVTTMVKNISLSKASTVAAIPITTRGIGFLSQMVFDAMSEVPKVATTGITAIDVYHVSLASLQVQLSISETKIGLLRDPSVIPSTQEVNYGLAQQVLNARKTPAPLAMLLNSVGSFKHGQNEYVTFVPQGKAVSLSVPTSSATDPKRRAIDREYVAHPHLVTFENLRSTVITLSNPAPELQQLRAYFRSNCAIPDTVWDETDVLLNPDVICPANYVANLRTRINRFNNAMSLAQVRFGHSFRECRFDGKGAPMSLVSFLVKDGRASLLADLPPDDLARDPLGGIGDAVLICGAMTLLGEKPELKSMLADEDSFSYRHPGASVENAYVCWTASVDASLRRQ